MYITNAPIQCNHDKFNAVKNNVEKIETEDEDKNYSMDLEIVQEINSQIETILGINKELCIINNILMADMNSLPQFANGQKRLICLQTFQKEFKGCEHRASCWQIHLSLAWAISIHKSQGMKIDWLYVDLKGCFAVGQAYVTCV